MRCSLLYLVLVVVVGACDTGERSTVATATVQDVNACVLVDASDAARVLGSPAVVDTTPAGGFGEASSCAWITESEALLVVTVFEGRMFYGGSAGLPGAEALEVGATDILALIPHSVVSIFKWSRASGS